MSNVNVGTSFGEYAERYNAKQTRMLMMDYENALYVWLIERLSEYRQRHALLTNADAVVKLVEDVFNEKAPKEWT